MENQGTEIDVFDGSDLVGAALATLEVSRGRIQDDAGAVSAFVRQLELSPISTERAYSKEVRRFLAWLLYSGYPPGNALANLNSQDIEAFFGFLRSRTPLEKPNGEGFWKHPAPLGESSLEMAKSRLSVFFDKLEDLEAAPGVPFRSGNPVKAIGRVVAARREPRKPGEKVVIAGEEDQERLLSIEDIDFVMSSIEQMPRETPREVAHYHRCKWLFKLAYHSWLRISEISRLQMCDFEFKDGMWRLYIWPSKHAKEAAVIDVFPALMDALVEYRKSLGRIPHPFASEKDPAVMAITNKVIKQKPVTTLLATGAIRIEDAITIRKPMTERALYAVLKQIFLNASLLATGEQTVHLRAASPHWLRHSGITHALNKGMDPRYVARQARHKNILTTLGVYDGGMTQELRKQQMELV